MEIEFISKIFWASIFVTCADFLLQLYFHHIFLATIISAVEFSGISGLLIYHFRQNDAKIKENENNIYNYFNVWKTCVLIFLLAPMKNIWIFLLYRAIFGLMIHMELGLSKFNGH
jgi:hypothetical protein